MTKGYVNFGSLKLLSTTFSPTQSFKANVIASIQHLFSKRLQMNSLYPYNLLALGFPASDHTTCRNMKYKMLSYRRETALQDAL